jgi:hypothetical protein
MVYIQGPVYVSIFKINNKNIFLFGDQHDTNHKDKLTKTKFITEFIDNLKPSTDVFLESYFLGKKNKRKLPIYDSISTITTVYNHYKDKMYNHNKREINLRVHYTDVRTSTDLIFFMNMIFLLIETLTDTPVEKNRFVKLYANFPTVQSLKQYSDMMLLSNSFEKDIAQKLKRFEINVNDVAFYHNNKSVHRIRKQLLKLSNILQNKIIKYHNDVCDEFIHKYSKYDKAVSNIKKDNNNKYIHYDELFVLETLLAWTSHLKDVYTLSRMLYYIIKGHHNIVSYDGYAHTKRYVKFFKNYIDDTEHVYTKSVINAKKKTYLTIPNKVLA